MNRIKWIIATMWATAGLAAAADNVAISVTSEIAKTNTATSVVQVAGYVDSVYLSSPTSTPFTVTLTTPKETLLSVTCTNSGTYRVRLQDCTSTGASISQYDRLMVFDVITLAATQTAGTNTVSCLLRLANASTQ